MRPNNSAVKDRGYAPVSRQQNHPTSPPPGTLQTKDRKPFLQYSKSFALACENIRFSSLFVAEDVSRGGTENCKLLWHFIAAMSK